MLSVEEVRAFSHKRRRERQRRRWLLLAAAAGLVVAVAGFGAGYRSAAGEEMAVVPPQLVPRADAVARAAGLLLLDEALAPRLAAHHAEMSEISDKVRPGDPDSGGVDILKAASDWREGSVVGMVAVAEEDWRRGDDPDGAQLVLALGRRDERQSGVGDAGDRDEVLDLLAAGAEAQPSSLAPWLLAAELHRGQADEAAAHAAYLAGLHRHRPWHAAELIMAKMRLAADEAAGSSQGKAGAGFAVPRTLAGEAMSGLRRSVLAGDDPRPALGRLRAVVTAKTLQMLVADFSLQVPEVPRPLIEERAQVSGSVPYSEVAGPELD